MKLYYDDGTKAFYQKTEEGLWGYYIGDDEDHLIDLNPDTGDGWYFFDGYSGEEFDHKGKKLTEQEFENLILSKFTPSTNDNG